MGTLSKKLHLGISEISQKIKDLGKVYSINC